MTQVNSVNSFEGKQKFSAYDLKRAEEIAVLSLAGENAKAKEAFDEFAKDKKFDKARNIAIGAGALAVAMFARRATGGKITKWLATAGDVVADWFRKSAGDGKKVVTEFLDKGIDNTKIKTKVKKIIDKLVKNPEYNASVKKFIKENVEKWSEKLKIKQFKDVAELGVAAGLASVADEPVKKIADEADDGKNMNKKIAEGEEV